jgi:KDO2-lipid IV(A) lauroyltransferase
MTLLLRALARAFALLPWRELRAVGAVLGWFAGSVARIRRRHVESSMAASGVASPAREAGAMYRSLGVSAAEFLWLAGRGPGAAIHAQVDERSRGALAEAFAGGKGVVFAASHTGNWDLAACAMARALRGLEFLVVTKHLRARGLDRFWQETRGAQGVSLAPPEGAMERALRTLSRGGAVAMMIDQVPEVARHAVRGAVLGRPAWIDVSPAVVAARAHAPLVVAASRREANGEHTLAVLGVFVPPPRAGRAWIEATAVAASRALDRFVDAHPGQWLWLHRRWRDPRGLRPSRRSPNRRRSGTAEAPELHSLSPCKTPSSSPDTPSPAA